MQKKIVSLAAPILIGIIALALGWFAHAAVPLSAQGIVMDGHAMLSDPALPAAPAGTLARLTYQGRLTDRFSSVPINTSVLIVFKLYDSTNALLWTSATRNVTPLNGLFTVYLGAGSDPDLNNTILGQAAYIGVTVCCDQEMNPKQALNSVVGHGVDGVGVLGSSNTNAGVLGSSIGNAGVAGSSIGSVGVYGSSNSNYGVQGYSTLGNGVVGTTGVITRAAVLAQAAGNSGIALEISSGGIKATSAGFGTNTFAFIHTSSGGSSFSPIDNALTNRDPKAMLFVTQVLDPDGFGGIDFNRAFGVAFFYDPDPSLQQWQIFAEDGMVIPIGVKFNVLVIKR